MDSSVSPKDEIWFLRVCHHISTALYLFIVKQYGTCSSYCTSKLVYQPPYSCPFSPHLRGLTGNPMKFVPEYKIVDWCWKGGLSQSTKFHTIFWTRFNCSYDPFFKNPRLFFYSIPFSGDMNLTEHFVVCFQHVLHIRMYRAKIKVFY